MKKPILSLLPLLFLFASCATFITPTAPLAMTAEADPAVGYLFGTISVLNKEFFSAGFGLEYVSLDNPEDNVILAYPEYRRNPETVLVKDGRAPVVKETLVVVPIRPGRYRLANVMFLSLRKTLSGRQPVTVPEYTREFEVRAGSVYYVGDWLGMFTSTTSSGTIRSEWRILSVDDRLDDTKPIVSSEYPDLKDWTVETTVRAPADDSGFNIE